MRNTFATELVSLAENRDDVMLFYADIGNRLFDPLKQVASERTINAGIAEANMASMAAGAAKMGMRPFIYTITPFTTARNFEQIKVDIAYQNQPVVIVGTGSGMAYANLGPTHHSFEDIALMRSLPNMTIVCPADSAELRSLLPKLMTLQTPVYLRIGKKNEPAVYDDTPNLEIGEASILENGREIAILACGTIMPLAQDLAVALRDDGLTPELVSMHTVSPLDENYLRECANRFKQVITLEEHNVDGGFGSAILEFFNREGINIQVHRFGLPRKFIDKTHSQLSARKKAGLTVEAILRQLAHQGLR